MIIKSDTLFVTEKMKVTDVDTVITVVSMPLKHINSIDSDNNELSFLAAGTALFQHTFYGPWEKTLRALLHPGRFNYRLYLFKASRRNLLEKIKKSIVSQLQSYQMNCTYLDKYEIRKNEFFFGKNSAYLTKQALMNGQFFVKGIIERKCERKIGYYFTKAKKFQKLKITLLLSQNNKIKEIIIPSSSLKNLSKREQVKITSQTSSNNLTFDEIAMLKEVINNLGRLVYATKNGSPLFFLLN